MKNFFCLLFFGVFILFTQNVYAEAPEFTEDDIIERITIIVESIPETVSYIPELKTTFGEDRKILQLEYEIEGIFKNITELDKETLLKIYSRLNNERTRLQTERLMRQLESIRAAQEAVNRTRTIGPGSAPVTPPVPVTPPKVPPVPPAPVTQPKVPPVPPAPPKR